jgi:hypothetical protein
MKTKTGFISLFLLVNALSLHAMPEKQFLDTVIITCNERVQLKIAVYNDSELKKDTTVTSIVRELQKSLGKVKDNLPAGFYKILYNPGESMIIEKRDPESKFRISGESVTPFIQRNECEVIMPTIHLYFTFQQLSDLLDPSLNPCITSSIGKLPEKVRYAQTFHYTYTDQTGAQETLRVKSNGLDMLTLKAGIGASIIKNTLVTDIGGEIGFNFNKKGILKNCYFLSANAAYVFSDQSDHFAINGFLNAGYKFNLSNDRLKSNWIGAELGLPIHKEGALFTDNLFKFAIQWELGKSVYVSGQLYINKGFESAYPGLRIGFFF